MKNNHVKIYSILTVIIIILLVVIVSRELKINTQNELSLQLETDMNSRINKLNDNIDSLIDENRLLSDKLNNSEEMNSLKATEIKRLKKELELSVERIEDLIIVDHTTIRNLENQGIFNYKDIELDLAEKPELIGYDGVLGGTMFFWSIHLLDDRWVYAEFEDGHIAGSGIYEYTIDENGMITWKNICEELY